MPRTADEEPSSRSARGGVQSVERAFDLLNHIADAGGRTTLSELSASVDLPMPTIHRLLKTLVGLGAARQLSDRGYALGPSLIRLGNLAGEQLGTIARPYLRALVNELSESANVAVLDGDMVVYADQVPSSQQMRMFTEVGRRVHPHCTAVGKALLADTPEEDVRALLARTGLPRHTDRTLTRADDFVAALSAVREQGYALDEGEQEVGVRCVAVALDRGPLALALSISGPAPRMTD